MIVTSTLQAKARINNGHICKTPCEEIVAPGPTRIEVSGNVRQRQFSKVLNIQLPEGESREVPFSFQLMKVQIRGQAANMKVLALDYEAFDSDDDSVRTYEGRHTLVLVNSSTGKTQPAECEVKAGERVCTVVQPPR